MTGIDAVEVMVVIDTMTDVEVAVITTGAVTAIVTKGKATLPPLFDMVYNNDIVL